MAIMAARAKIANRYWMVCKVESERCTPIAPVRWFNIFTTAESFLQYNTTTPQSKGPIMAAARPEREYKPKNWPSFSFGTRWAKSGREAVQVEPKKIPVREPKNQKIVRLEVKATKSRVIIQPHTTKERVFLGPILSVTQPQAKDPTAAEVVEMTKNRVFSPSPKPITA